MKVRNQVSIPKAACDLKQFAEWIARYSKAVCKKERENFTFFLLVLIREKHDVLLSQPKWFVELWFYFWPCRRFIFVAEVSIDKRGIHMKRAVSYRGTCDFALNVDEAFSSEMFHQQNRLIQVRSGESAMMFTQLDLYSLM